MGGSKKKKPKESADIKKKKGEIKDLNQNIEEASEIVTDLAADLEETLAEKKKFEEYNERLEAAADAKWSEFLGDLPEAGSGELAQKERDKMRTYLEKYANKMYDYYGARGNNQGKVGQDVRFSMSEDQLKRSLTRAYGHSKEFGDELKKIVQDSRRFLWDRKVDLGQSKIEQNMDVVKSKYVAQYGAYQGMIGDYRETMTDIAKKRLSLEGYYKTDTYNQDFKKWAAENGWKAQSSSMFDKVHHKGVLAMQNGLEYKAIKGPDGEYYHVPKGSGGLEGDAFLKWNEKRGEEAFHAKYSDTDFSAMTLDELEHISAGNWDSRNTKPGIWGAMQRAHGLGTKQEWKQDQDWDRDIEDLDSFKWE